MKALSLCLLMIQFASMPTAFGHTNADEKLAADDLKALHDTQVLLKSKAQRQEYLKTHKDAQDVDDKAGAIAGSPADKEEIYGLSADVFEKVVAEAKGDPQKMQELLTQAQKNPEAFYNKYFSTEQKSRLKKIADKSEARKPTATPPH